MNREILKPAISKILVSWLVMSFVLTGVLGVLNWRDITDGLIAVIGVLVVFFQCFFFCLIFYNLPYFKIEINDSRIIGPRGLGGGWQRIEMPIEDIDIQNINSTLQWLGFYIIRSKAGERLSVWGFDEKQFNRLLGLVNNRRSRV